MDELFQAQVNLTTTASLLALAGMLWTLATAFAASVVRAAKEARPDGSLVEDQTQTEDLQRASRR